MEHENILHDRLTRDCGFFVAYEREILSFRSPFQEVRLLQSFTFGLILVLDGKIQSTQMDEFIYHEALVHPAMLSHPSPKSVFVAGGGEGATLREVLRYPSVETVLMVDLDRDVVDLCRRRLGTWHRGGFEDPRARVLHRDARSVLEEGGTMYDVIICDLSEPVDDGPSYLLFTQEFYRLCRARLNPGGVLVTQAGCPSSICSLSFQSVACTLESVFAGVSPYTAFVPSFASEWGFVLAGDDVLFPHLTDGALRNRLAPVENGLRYLDLETARALFVLPRHQRENRRGKFRIIRDGEPLIVD